MSSDFELKVNVLPVTTYNFLHVNESAVKISELSLGKRKSTDEAELPSGVSKKSGVSFDEAGKVFGSFSGRINVLADGYAAPNGDTSERDKEQAVRTGMGADVDRLMRDMNVTSDVYTVDEGVKADKPIVILDKYEDGEMALLSYVIHAKKDSEITVTLMESSERSAAGLSGISVRLMAEDGAKITLVKTQMLGDGFVHFYDIGGACLEGAGISLVTLELGGCDVHSSAYMNLSEDNSAYSSNLAYLARDDHRLDFNYVADQRGKKTETIMNFKGVLMDRAQKTFRGTLDFKSGSSGSVGDEQEDALLLSPDVVNRTMPVILCQEEDVEGRHGATIGQLTEELLFYMMSRGIDEESARRIMVSARLESIARLIPDPGIMQKTIYYIRNIL